MSTNSARILAGLTFVLGILWAQLVDLGMAWINVGHGLHPVLAFTLATLCPCGVIATWNWFLRSEHNAANY